MIYNDQVIQIEYPSLYYSWSCRGKCIDSGLCNSSEREKISRWRSPSVPKYELLKACVFEWTVYTYNAHIGHTWVSADFIPPLSTIGLLLNETRNNGGGWYMWGSPDQTQMFLLGQSSTYFLLLWYILYKGRVPVVLNIVCTYYRQHTFDQDVQVIRQSTSSRGDQICYWPQMLPLYFL